KTRHVESLIVDLRLTFDNLQTYDIKLNPEKCVFGVPSGKLLGFIAYRNAVLKMSARFKGLEFHHVVRENNQAADILARIGAKRDPVPPNIFLEMLFKPSVVWEGETDNN
ncbi:reverse transcriptase-like protein, partial [Escherichia coli]|uniref:reverse transcriptase-like protein n=1 Tax=Escherichia coli TaxID=562 RepID=UPI00321BBE97